MGWSRISKNDCDELLGTKNIFLLLGTWNITFSDAVRLTGLENATRGFSEQNHWWIFLALFGDFF
jgi:hypothetical protein